MSEEKKVCTYCRATIKLRKGSKTIVNFTNVTQTSPYYFCGQKCKKAWLTDRINKSQSTFKEWSRDERIKKKLFDAAGNIKTVKGKFYCKYCESEWPSDASKFQHERWCDENPNKRTYRTKSKALANLKIEKASGGKKEETEEEAQKEADAEEATEVAQYLGLTKPTEPKEILWTVKEIRELDRRIGLTDEQIARLVRGEKRG